MYTGSTLSATADSSQSTIFYAVIVWGSNFLQDDKGISF